MNEYQLTFQVDTTSGKAAVTHLLPTLAKKFKSTLHIVNISRNRIANLCDSLAVLQAGLIKGDICQITAIGIDAQLACFVIKNIVDKYYLPIASASDLGFSNELAKQVPQLSPSCTVIWLNQPISSVMTKYESLEKLANLISPIHAESMLTAFTEREEHTSTWAAPSIALPHIMTEETDELTVAVLRSQTTINWESKNGDVLLVIALVLPSTPTKQQIVAASNLARNLTNELFAERLVVTKHSIELQALLMHSMTRLF